MSFIVVRIFIATAPSQSSIRCGEIGCLKTHISLGFGIEQTVQFRTAPLLVKLQLRQVQGGGGFAPALGWSHTPQTLMPGKFCKVHFSQIQDWGVLALDAPLADPRLELHIVHR
eukprot:m.198512 g.198512  ORF g.198512 m.198512 type:complete len:114 (+) comp32697_c0_seq4:1020-1361(+)